MTTSLPPIAAHAAHATRAQTRRWWLGKIPDLLVGLRALVLAPAVLGLLANERPKAAAGVYFLALLSDIYDGVIARKLGVSTLRLRLADSAADVVLFVCLGVGILIGFAGSLTAIRTPFLCAAILQGASWLFCLGRFGKMTSYHSALAKCSGLALFGGILGLLLGGMWLPLFWALWLLVLALLEEIAMTAVLPAYAHDVWSLKAALRERRKEEY